jgi:uncharacterized surface protein with fasciclin (FAS1) repeats
MMMPINVNPLNTPSTTTSSSSTTAPEYTPIAYSAPVVDTYTSSTTSSASTPDAKTLPPVPDFARNYGLLVEFFGRLFNNPMLGDLFTRLFQGLLNNTSTPRLAPSLGAIANNPKLETFETVLKSSQFDLTISAQESKGPVTVFAPTEAAFNKLDPKVKTALLKPENKATLEKILKYHVAEKPVKFGPEPQSIDSLLPNASDQSVLTGTALKPRIINGKQIVQGESALALPNKSILVPIDDILIPPDVDLSTLVGLDSTTPTPPTPPVPPAPGENQNTAGFALKNNTTLSTLNSLLASTKLNDALGDLEKTKPVTILAPTEAAFNKLDPALKEKLLKPANSEALKQILQYHVSESEYAFKEEPQGFDSLLANTADNNVLTGTATAPRIINGKQIVLGTAPIVTPNKSTIIPIDQVLIPPNLDLSKLV